MKTIFGHARTVIASYDGTGPGFVDRLILRDTLAHAAVEIKTFDQDFARLDKVALLE